MIDFQIECRKVNLILERESLKPEGRNMLVPISSEDLMGLGNIQAFANPIYLDM